MTRKNIALITIALLINLIVSCSTIGTFNSNEITNLTPNVKFTAKKTQELEIITTQGDTHFGKILSLEGEKAILLTLPYWNVIPVEIDLDEIHKIKLVKKKSRAGKGAAKGFVWAFTIIGLIGLVSSEYDEDYEEALGGSLVSGAFGGLLGLVIGGISSISVRSQYNFYDMSKEQKIKAIKKIMGL